MSVLVESGHLPAPELGQPGILALADTTRLRELFMDAGLADPEIDEVPFGFPFAGEDDYWRFLTDMAGAIAMALGRLDDDARAAVRSELATRLEPYGAPDDLVLPAVSLVAVASRP
jgi:hypothetical protein